MHPFLIGLWHFILSFAPVVLAITVPTASVALVKALGPDGLAKAQQLSHIAGEVATAVIANNKNASWAMLLQLAITDLSNAVGVPTQNQGALTRAATTALLAAGAKP